MIKNIHIENFALIKDQTIELKPGLNIITGETGSGKSIFALAIAGIFGEDLSDEQILYGENNLRIQCELELGRDKCEKVRELTGVDDEDGTYVISRNILGKGRNSIRLNGSIISLSTLRKLGTAVFDFHTQNETKELLKKENQVKLLDQFCGPGFKDILDGYNRSCRETDKLYKKFKELREDIKGIETKKDILRFQIDEIEKTAPDRNEYESLLKKRDILLNSEKILKSLADIRMSLHGAGQSENDPVENIRKAAREFEQLSQFYESYSKISEELQGIYWRLRDIAGEISIRIDSTGFDPSELDMTIARLEQIERLKKKYGGGIDDVLGMLGEKKKELEELENIDMSAASMEAAIIESKKKLAELNDVILEKRKAASDRLCGEIVAELAGLDMKDVRFDVYFEEKDTGAKGFCPNGNQEVRFAISTNKGQPLKYLDEISSGGEMSRVMLVFKKLVSSFDETEILVFDEIESGVSGATAFKMGEKIFDISKRRQVICITHIPQIAIFSDNHYKAYKVENDGATFSVIERITEDDKIVEIGKLLGGSRLTENVLTNAKELIKAGRGYIFRSTETVI